MVLLLECFVGMLLFALITVPSTARDPLSVISDYPPAIRKRCIELGLVKDTKKRFTPKDIIRKVIAVIVLVILLSFILKRLNKPVTFFEAFRDAYIIWLAITWFDAFIVDCLWFCHSPKTRIPGAEDMKEYHDYLFHIRQSLIGSLIGIPACLIVAAVTMAL